MQAIRVGFEDVRRVDPAVNFVGTFLEDRDRLFWAVCSRAWYSSLSGRTWRYNSWAYTLLTSSSQPAVARVEVRLAAGAHSVSASGTASSSGPLPNTFGRAVCLESRVATTRRAPSYSGGSRTSSHRRRLDKVLDRKCEVVDHHNW